MSISPTTSISKSSPAQPPESPNPTSGLGQTDFLKLLTVQMKNQDPMKPSDNNAFIAQMAQFAQLNQIQDIKAACLELNNRLQTMGMASALNFVGKSVLLQDEQAPRQIIGLVANPDGSAPLLHLDDGRAVAASNIQALG